MSRYLLKFGDGARVSQVTSAVSHAACDTGGVAEVVKVLRQVPVRLVGVG